MTSRITRRALGAGALAAAAAALTACGGDPLRQEGGSGSDAGGQAVGSAIRVGCQDYYSNEIIAELYAQVIEKAGGTVDRQYRIGQREVYMSEIQSGALDVFPEYSGATLQYLDRNATAATREEIDSALAQAMPDGWSVLASADASDQDSFNVTPEFAQQHSLTSLEDLAGITDLKVAANSEFETRPFGPKGLKDTYGVDVTLVPVEDSGGPLTVKALMDGSVQIANIYSADPAIEKNTLVTLEDPKALVLPQNVTPMVKSALEQKYQDAITQVNQKLTTDELVTLNTNSVDSGAGSAEIATAWLQEQGLL